MGVPAARLGDLHSHGPATAPIAPPCAVNVLIGGMPAARVTDAAFCGSGLDPITMGSTTVLIGSLPAARIGDPTALGGVIVTGCVTVLIGNRSTMASAFAAAAATGTPLVCKDTCASCHAVAPGSAGTGTPAPTAVTSSAPAAPASGPAAPPPPSPQPISSRLPLPPRSMAETSARLDRAAARIAAARASGAPLPTSPFTTQDKLRIAAIGLEEDYIVRVTKKQYARDDQRIGRPLASGKGAYWTTTFTQLEYADHDPELICQAVGVPYDPDSDYTLMVIDAGAAAEQGDQLTFIPTYERLGALVKQELTDASPEDIDAVMTPEYSEIYARLSSKAASHGLVLSKPLDLETFMEDEGLSPESENALTIRSKIEAEFGANVHFLGNGLTKNLDPATASRQPYGLLEAFTYDRNPQTLGALEGAGALVRQDLPRYRKPRK